MIEDPPPARDRPGWAEAADALLTGLVALPRAEERTAFLIRCAEGLGPALYPSFLKVLCAVGRFGTDAAREALSEALADAAALGQQPQGLMAPWGTTQSAGLFLRRLGPLEYLCTLRMQGGGPAITPADFEGRARDLCAVIAASPRGAALYADKLAEEAADQAEGRYSRDTRQLLAAAAEAFRSGASPAAFAAALAAEADTAAAAAQRRRLGL